MKKAGLFFVFSVLMAALAGAAEENLMQRDSLTGGFWGLSDALEPSGIEFSFSLTGIYQINTQGGISTHRRQGRWTGIYDLEMGADMQRLAGFEGGILYMHAEGTWPRNDIDATSVGSLFGVNGDFAPREAFNIIELWYQQNLWEDTLQLRIGKLDMTGGFECSGCPVSFDGNRYANDENTQFLNAALVNNPTIPFPDYGLGAIAHWNPVQDWYFSIGAADAQADKRETGFNTAFHGEDYFVYMAETGITPRLDSASGPLQGAYRVGIWYDPQPRPSPDESNFYRDETGLYVSCDQSLTRETADDQQGLGAFFRYGYSHSRSSEIPQFYSFGFQYQGLLEGRDEDVLAAGYAHGSLNDRTASPFTEDYESVIEVYYAARITRWMALTPSVQFVKNPGGESGVGDALVFGMRAFVTF